MAKPCKYFGSYCLAHFGDSDFDYDLLGRRIAKQTEHGKIDYIWDNDQLIGEYQHGEYTWYINLPNQFHPVALIKQGELYYYHLDQLNTPRFVTNNNAEVVWQNHADVYGYEEPEANADFNEENSFTQPIRFQGQYFDDESGLHYNRYCYYSPKQQRFINQDPIGLVGGINHYQYAPNPVNWVDPFGLSCKEGKPDFYVGPSGPDATIASTGYRYMRYKDDNGKVNKFAPMTIENLSAPTTYFGFIKYNSGLEARDAFQIKGNEFGPDENGDGSWSDARLRGEFDTLQLFENGEVQARIPYWKGDTDETKLEPFAEAYTQYGDGGAVQLHADGRKIKFDSVEIIKEKPE